ncbi:MsnO8 family LLM class oxidoreductase [Chitinophaga sp. 212800010-3]|uniref:MsnO8 family LLM class oxidoreductase n=1 Tax=Bacteroidota TaxID=976 RepID=UPI001AC92EA0|nr:MsnO8 family LLM class oxidoreductase [Chitinophaga sp. 212800010-3]MBN8880578.1 MsnO8 family LLM class oxidoreductase [Sphingobacteriales bacterium]MBN9484385.1 MsnO8 family LLM class oxidoreductase [Bacteroidota bacterium]MEC5143526.1 Bac-luciferase domain-containing protein [Chitinophaga sp. 212800010-3]
MKLSILDISYVPYGGNRRTALQNTIETAQVAEDLGYERIWFAEHHNIGHIAGRTPEVMTAAAAANTKRIHVGSGAVLLNHYSPYKVAEVFATLCELYPGRIDLGIGRATTGQYSDFALQSNRTSLQKADNSMEQLVELLAWLTNDFPSNHPFSQVKLNNDGSLPNVYLLGTSDWSAEAAARLGLAYVFAAFITSDQQRTFDITRHYIENFQPSNKPYGRKAPGLTLTVYVYAHENDELALELAAPSLYSMQLLNAGRREAVNQSFIPEKEALELLNGSYTLERLTNPNKPPRHFIGKAETVARELKQMQAAFGLEEIMIQLISGNHLGRLKSFELLSQAIEKEKMS